ncbi:MAG: nodulation protein NfeD [Chloroflexi bacterium]|nr:nodulation protein NfeD [Chloroflexota bacterium]
MIGYSRLLFSTLALLLGLAGSLILPAATLAVPTHEGSTWTLRGSSPSPLTDPLRNGGRGGEVSAAAPDIHATGLAGGSHVVVAEARGMVNPVMAGYITRVIAQAEREQAEALVIQLDTPGGLDTSMREIIQAIVGSRVPVIVYVAPPGGRAASAGLFITMAAHVAAMAPDTNMGSAHPVMIGPGGPGAQPSQPDTTMVDKVTNDAVALIRGLAERRGRNADWAERAVRESVNVGATEALRLGIVEIVAGDVPDLLRQVDGRMVMLPEGSRALRTAGLPTAPAPMSVVEQFLHVLSDPNVAYILMTIGVYGLIYELASPGHVFPGIVGVISLVLGLYALGTLPVNYAALALIAFAFALLLAEVFVAPGIGALAVGGIIALVLGSLLLFNGAGSAVQLSPWVIAGVVIATTGFFLVVVRGVRQSLRRPVQTGREALIGALATVQSDLKPRGVVHLNGELWEAVALDGVIPRNAVVRIEQVQGLTLLVRAARDVPAALKG